MTKSEKRLFGLDHLREFAIVFVLLYHYPVVVRNVPDWLLSIGRFGWTGVDLFFVLSGFLISSQLFAEIKKHDRISLKEFYVKRFFRIIPAYLFAVGLYLLLPFFREREALSPLWKFLTFTMNFGLDVQRKGTFSHAWSLCVEEHFYLILPFILLLLLRTKLFSKSYWIIILLFLFGLVIRHCNYQNIYLPNINKDNSFVYWYKYIYYPTYTRLDGLLTGVSIAALYQFLPKVWCKISRYGNFLFITGLIILVAAYFLCKDQDTYKASVLGFPVISIGYGVVLMSAISSNSFLYRCNSTITTFIATLSFGIYLTHKGIIHIVHSLLGNFKINASVMFFISILIAILFALLLHVIIEKPFMKLRQRVIKSHRMS